MSDLSDWVDRASTCPLCGNGFRVRQWRIVDIDAHPKLVADCHDGTLSRDYCPRCIGPGVQRIGAGCLVWRDGDRVCRGAFLPPGTRGADRVADAVAALDASLMARLDAAEIPRDRVFHVGAAILRDWDGLGDKLAEWAGAIGNNLVTPEMLQDIFEFMRRDGPESRAAFVRANPRLVRPSAIKTLAGLPDLDDRISLMQVRPLLTFLTHCTRFGLDAAEDFDTRQEVHLEVLRGMRGDERTRFLSFLPEELTAETLAAMARREEDLLSAFPAPDYVPLHAIYYENLGGGWARLVDADPERAFAAGVPAYEALLALDPDAVPLRMRLDALLGLSTLHDKASARDPAIRAQAALHWAEAAKDLLEVLSDEDAARVWTEIGILYTRLLTGDSALNKARARHALESARLPGASDLSRYNALYNHALTYVEETTGDIIRNLRAGLGMLNALEDEIKRSTSAEFRRNFHRSKGAAILKLVAHDPGSALRLSEGLQSLMEARRLVEETGAAYEEPRLLVMMCDMALRQHRAGVSAEIDLQALAGFMQAALIASQKQGDVLAAADALGLMADLYSFVDAPEDAAKALQAALDLVPETGWWGKSRALAVRLGDIQSRLGAHDLADVAYGTAVAATEMLYQQAATPSTKDEAVTSTAELYRRWIDTGSHVLAGAAGALELAARMEQARARQLLDALGQSHLDAPPSVPAELLATEAALRGALADMPAATGSYAAERDAALRIETLRRLDDTLEQIAASGPAGRSYVDRRRPRPPDPEALAKGVAVLPEGSLILCFYRVQGDWLGVCLGPNVEPRAIRLALAQGDLEAALASFEADILSRKLVDGDLAPASHLWCEMGETLLGPFAPELEAAESLLIVPHEDLHRLPMAALHLDGSPIISRVPLRTVPSLGILRALSARPHMRETALVLSAAETRLDRDGMDAEARTVAQILETNATLDACRSDFLDRAADAGIIHLCCHGAFEPGDPMNARLRLRDGALTAGDLEEIDLRAWLCVLSACETGQMGIRSGDRLAGFAQVLLESGVQIVLLTLWEVFNEATRDWMIEFYRYLVAHDADVTRAHQTATIAIMARQPDPIYWAPFALVGATGGATTIEAERGGS